MCTPHDLCSAPSLLKIRCSINLASCMSWAVGLWDAWCFSFCYSLILQKSVQEHCSAVHIAVTTQFNLEEQPGLLPGTVVLLCGNLKFLLNKWFLCSVVKTKQVDTKNVHRLSIMISIKMERDVTARSGINYADKYCKSTKVTHYWKCCMENTAQIARSRRLWDCFLKDLMLRLGRSHWEYLRG